MNRCSRWFGVGLGLSVGSLAGIPGLLALACFALPLYILWVVIVDGPDRRAAGNWRRGLEEAEILAWNNIRRGRQ
jgi:hypothetical protein